MAVITRAQVEARMIGLLPYIAQVPEAAVTEMFRSNINSAVSLFENWLTINLKPRVIKMWPQAGAEYDLEEPPLPYNMALSRTNQFPIWRLRSRPVISIDRFRLAFGPEPGMSALEVPPDWWRPNLRLGTISIMPIGTTAAIMDASVVWYLPLLSGGFRGQVPQMVCIDYTSGVDLTPPEDPDADDPQGNLRYALTQQAAIGVMRDMRRLVPASASAGGLSQAFSTIDSDIEDMKKEIDSFIERWNVTDRPMRVGVV